MIKVREAARTKLAPRYVIASMKTCSVGSQRGWPLEGVKMCLIHLSAQGGEILPLAADLKSLPEGRVSTKEEGTREDTRQEAGMKDTDGHFPPLPTLEQWRWHHRGGHNTERGPPTASCWSLLVSAHLWTLQFSTLMKPDHKQPLQASSTKSVCSESSMDDHQGITKRSPHQSFKIK